jgi:cyclopropane fatty-acyl-phospholipid synthase-like methyltransferase
LHAEAYAWVKQHAPTDAETVLDIGGRNINGTVRDLFPNAVYRVLDINADHDVDIVADASTWTPDQQYDVVVCCEVFEHTPVWPAICTTAHEAMKPGGALILTMAGPGRAPHSARDGGSVLYDGEHYDNIHPNNLEHVLHEAGFTDVTIDQQHEPMADVRAIARRP